MGWLGICNIDDMMRSITDFHYCLGRFTTTFGFVK